jgi:hypothetical protein
LEKIRRFDLSSILIPASSGASFLFGVLAVRNLPTYDYVTFIVSISIASVFGVLLSSLQPIVALHVKRSDLGKFSTSRLYKSRSGLVILLCFLAAFILQLFYRLNSSENSSTSAVAFLYTASFCPLFYLMGITLGHIQGEGRFQLTVYSSAAIPFIQLFLVAAASISGNLGLYSLLLIPLTSHLLVLFLLQFVKRSRPFTVPIFMLLSSELTILISFLWLATYSDTWKASRILENQELGSFSVGAAMGKFLLPIAVFLASRAITKLNHDDLRIFYRDVRRTLLQFLCVGISSITTVLVVPESAIQWILGSHNGSLKFSIMLQLIISIGWGVCLISAYSLFILGKKGALFSLGMLCGVAVAWIALMANTKSAIYLSSGLFSFLLAISSYILLVTKRGFVDAG